MGETGISILSEEDTDDKKRLSEEKIWIVDPLDGTTDFVNRTGEFTIMVGLVEKQKSILGLIYWPIKKKMYLAESGKGVFCHNEEWEKIEVSMMSEIQNCHALVSRHHLSEREKKHFLKRLKMKFSQKKKNKKCLNSFNQYRQLQKR